MGKEYTEAQKKAILKYQADKVKIQILVTPEQRDRYKALAQSNGLNLTQLIIALLNREIKNTELKEFEQLVNKAFKDVEGAE